MPRIDPIQLLNCLSVLLSPNGGIKSRVQVQRLASLMTKFSKKLVSKCIYIQILKCTETDLLGLYMESGGWLLVHMWLTESIVAKNWPLVKELLELLLLCPVDIERLKTNNCPKLVKELSKDGNHFAIRALASKLVEQWLKTVKGEQVVPIQMTDITQIITEANNEHNADITVEPEVLEEKVVENHVNETENKVLDQTNQQTEDNNTITEKDVTDVKSEEEADKLPVLKISLKDGKQIVSQIDESENKNVEGSDTDVKEHHKSKSKDKSKDRSSSSSSKSSSSKHSSKKHSSSSDKSKSSHKSSSSSSRHSSKEGSKEKEKDKHSSSSSKSRSDSKSSKSSDKSNSSSSKSREERRSSDKDKKDEKSKEKGKEEKSKEKGKEEKSRDSGKEDKSRDNGKEEKSRDNGKEDKSRENGNEEKSKDNHHKSINEKLTDDKQTNPGTIPPSIHKLGKIPKLSDQKREKPSISIEVRKPDDPKPKTVKTFHSKFRKHGLEEEIKPPPSRAALLTKKPPTVVPPPSVPIPKRPSPVHNETPPEKKLKITEPVEKPGAIKLIPPKPKPMLLLESDMFMDALNASATNKKEPKKRKRRTSGSKDGNAPSDGSPPHTPTVLSSPSSESKSVPPRFYQDTLDTDENKEKSDKSSDSNETTEAEVEKPEEKIEIPVPHTITVNGLKGVLCYHKRKGPKKSIKWKPESELEEIQYFELDETERVNVTKTFTDMKHLERINESLAFQKGRNIGSEDVMEEKTPWRPLIPLDIGEGQIQVDYGKNSKERDIQAIRQKGTLQPLYFHKSMIPDSALEPEPETHPYTEPANIPLEDVTGNQDNVSDFRNMPWPEPKGNAPPVSSIPMPAMFPNNMMQVPNGFPNPPFPGVPGVPGFPGPNMVPGGDWQNGMPPPHMMNAVNSGVIPPGAIPPGTLPPGMMMPTDNMIIAPDGTMFPAPNAMFPMPPDGFNMQPNMFPMDFNMVGPQGPPPQGQEGFPGQQTNFRGAMRGRGATAGHWRGKASGNWDNNQRGRGGSRGSRKTVCIYFQRRGSCRQGDNCSFLHPGVNGPY